MEKRKNQGLFGHKRKHQREENLQMMRVENDADAVLTEEHTKEEQRNYTGSFCGFVLLDTNQYDLTALEQRLQQRWGIVPAASPEDKITVEGGQTGDWLDELLTEENVDILTAPEIQDGNLVFDIPGAMVAIGFMPAPIPDGEAERFAAGNYDWPDAVKVTKQHVAHLMVAVLPRELTPLEAGKTYVKIISSCLEAPEAIGVYTSGTVLEPAFYQDVTAIMEQGELPVLNWIYIGLYKNEAGNHAYTIGMDAFGKDELEVLNSSHSLEELWNLLFDIAYYVLADDVTLKDGETIGFTAEQKLPMKRGDGVAVEGHSIQIAYD